MIGDSAITRATDVRSKRVRWIKKGFIPLGYLTIGTGETKLGKSTFAAHDIAQATHGLLPGEFEGKPCRVLILAAEDGLGDLWKPRLVAAGADLDFVAFFNLPDNWNIRDGLPLIDRALREFPAPLIFIDAVMEHLPEAKGSENGNSTTFVRGALRPAARLAESAGVAIYMSTHPPKGPARGFSDAYHGSGAFVQVSRSCLLFGWHPDDQHLPEEDRRRVLLRAAGNIGRNPGSISFRIGGTTIALDDGDHDEIGYAHDVQPCNVTARDLLNADRTSHPNDANPTKPKVDILVDRISTYLADGEWHPSIRPELESEGFAGGTIYEAQKRVVYARKRAGTMGGGWEWRLKSSNPADTSTDHNDLARAGRDSLKPDRSTDHPVNPTDTEESNSQSSSTNGHPPNPEVSKSQDFREATRARRDDEDGKAERVAVVDHIGGWSNEALEELHDRHESGETQ